MAQQIISDLKKIADPEYIAVHEHFGIKAKKALGLRIPQLRAYAKKYKNNHELALQLWKSDIHEVKILAIFIADPKQVTEALTPREPEFEKRTGYSLMCYLAVHDKKAKDEKISAFFPLIEWGADDDRNFVKKAVN